ncbi:tRNA(Arg) A34 adenosine deaminase TadA [Pedobacter westerhofensis]|uniref:tRNA(Arg) A34 adenosine deaminase TadA n=1 Tax=Pedobacter westerhofensis TaxID=425512 RepID=A0A521D7R3_9SPHI|nr:nucleoside deaminase [Pedobacter westerhofensis]SMO67734.1 tRNA(Arg) A34 adenosine deaminase TadA [Pedobacter westerhofensis]
MNKEQEHEKFMRIAIALAEKNVSENLGGPFGAVIVKDGKMVAKSGNRVTTTNDPTAHAEVSAIRLACKKLKTYDLKGCVIYTSCEPCPMCLSAIYWARIDIIYQGNTKSDAAEIGFDDQFIYEELEKPVHARKVKVTELLRDEAQEAFKLWEDSGRKIHY